MDDRLIEIIDNLSIDELEETKIYIQNRMRDEKPNSWNSQISIKDAKLDYELTHLLESNKIHNMEQFHENGLNGIPESLIEKAEWSLRTFDFKPLEKEYKKSIT